MSTLRLQNFTSICILLSKQVPSITDYDMTKGQTYRYFMNDPLYPFGYGLSYSTFTYSNLVLANNTIEPGQLIDLSVQVKNNGPYDAEEVGLTTIMPSPSIN